MKHAIHAGTVRIAPTRSIIDVLRTMEVDAETVLQQAGVDPRIFDDPDNLVSFSARAHLMAVCREVTACPHFGLAVGQRDGLSAFGLVGYLAMHSPDVESALRCLMRYLHLHVQGSGVVLEREGGWAFLGYEIYQPLADGADQLEDGALAAMFNALRELCGVNWGPTEIWFTHRKPTDVRPFRSFFQAPLRYDMPRAGIYFSARWLERPVRAADPELHRLLQKRIDELDDARTVGSPTRVKRRCRGEVNTRRGRLRALRAASERVQSSGDAAWEPRHHDPGSSRANHPRGGADAAAATGAFSSPRACERQSFRYST